MRLSLALTRSLSVSRADSSLVKVEVFLDRLEEWLVNNHARGVSRVDNAISFKAGILSWRPGWNRLGGITSGRVEIATDSRGTQIDYRLNLAELILLDGALAALVAAMVNLAGELDAPAWQIFLVATVLWGVVVVVNGAFTMTRFFYLLRRVWEEVESDLRRSGSPAPPSQL